MNYYLGMARMHGYDDPTKEALWGQVPPEERLKILRHLLTYRSVREICNFEDDFTCPEDKMDEKLDELLVELSAVDSAGDLPITLNMFVFFACWGESFSLQFLEREGPRFLWLPDPLPDENRRFALATDFEDSIY